MNVLSAQSIFSFITVILSGMIAGLFYGYSCSVNIGLGRLNEPEYLKAMQSINKAILNPAFFLSFFGALVVLPVTTWLSYTTFPDIKFYLLFIASVIYIIGVFGITLFGNVPLNNSLEKFDLLNSSAESISIMREKFETNWNSLHHIRTYASILSFLLATISIMLKS